MRPATRAMSAFPENQQYFRVTYKRLDSRIRFCEGIRCDMKFEVDLDNNYVFSLYPSFESFSGVSTVAGKPEALEQGTAIIRKPIYPDRDGYFDMMRARVKVGEKAYFVGGSHKLAELEIIKIINEL